MVAKKKGLYLGLLLSLLGISNTVQAYFVVLKNETLNNVRFDVYYVGSVFGFCSNDYDKLLAPQGTLRIKTGGCLVNYVKARVFNKRDRTWVETSWRGVNAGGRFTVTGPHVKGLRYRITRK